MPRTARIVVPEVPHHITQRGNNKQDIFFVDDDYFLKALCYVERNPVRAGLADHAWDYAWSSARAHCWDAPRNALLHLDDWRDRMPGETWREVLESFLDDGEAAGRIYLHTNTGRPLGSDSFLSRLEVVLGRRVRPLPIGRPKGWRKKK